ncbi:uncharacterized protein LOC141685159 [Apium graveolens]|uniref:uncharacterized protein LOC141685159 n=1 Tax=Apium graveolens TaxID=4045 RepID=UPI003D78EB86
MQSLSSLFSHSPSLNATNCSSSSESNNSIGRFLLRDAFIKDDADQLVYTNSQQHCDDNDNNEDEFEFAFASVLSPVPADQIFCNGQIRPFYPHFKLEKKSVVSCMVPRAARLPLRKLLVEERELEASCSSSVTDEMEGVEARTYCIWDSKTTDDSPELCNNSIRRRKKLRDFLRKSNSSGNNSFAFLKFS